MVCVNCHDCGTTIYIIPVDAEEFNKRIADGNELIFCFNCFQKQENTKKDW